MIFEILFWFYQFDKFFDKQWVTQYFQLEIRQFIEIIVVWRVFLRFNVQIFYLYL